MQVRLYLRLWGTWQFLLITSHKPRLSDSSCFWSKAWSGGNCICHWDSFQGHLLDGGLSALHGLNMFQPVFLNICYTYVSGTIVYPLLTRDVFIMCHGPVVGTGDIKKRTFILTFPWRTLQSVAEEHAMCHVDTSHPEERGWNNSETERMSRSLIQGRIFETEGTEPQLCLTSVHLV